MPISKQEYKKMQKQSEPKSPVLKNCIWAFSVGGLICVIGETVVELAQKMNLTLEMSRMICCITLIFLSVLLTGLRVYDNIAKRAGAGTLVPITGFANAIASPAIEFKSEGFVLGMAAKMFTIAGPVLTYGISASVIYGIILWIFQLIQKQA